MLKKLSNIEKSRLYATVADLENAYGAETTKRAINTMIQTLDGGTIRTGSRAVDPVQLELLPFEPVKPRKKYNGRKAPGVNDAAIKTYFEEYIKTSNIRYETGDEALVKLYHIDGLTQDEIAAMVGVKQRAISQYLNKMPKRKKNSIIKYWSGGKEIGHK